MARYEGGTSFQQRLIRFRADDPILEKIDKVAAATGRSKNNVTVEAIRNGISTVSAAQGNEVIAAINTRIDNLTRAVELLMSENKRKRKTEDAPARSLFDATGETNEEG